MNCGAQLKVREAMESDEEIYITQDRFSSSRDALPEVDLLDQALFDEVSLVESLLETNQTNCVLPNEAERRKTCENGADRNISLVGDDELEKLKQTRIPVNTNINTKWAVRTWSDWAKERNKLQKIEELEGKYTVVNPDILKLQKTELNYWFSKLVVEVRKKKCPGACYPPNTLYQLCCGLLRYLRDNGWPALNIFTDPCFKHFQDCLDAEMKRLTRIGLGSEVKEARAFTEDQENKLWNEGILGDQSPQVLLDTMVFLIGKHFALRSGKEHRSLRFSQFTLVEATTDEPEKQVYCSFGEKNNAGGLKHRRIRQKKIEHYANVEKPGSSVVNLYKKYLAKCPEAGKAKDVFYLSARKGGKASDKGTYKIVHVNTRNARYYISLTQFLSTYISCSVVWHRSGWPQHTWTDCQENL